MKKLIYIIAILFACSVNLFAQESASPLTDTELVRKVSSMDIEGTVYENVEVTMKSTSPDYLISYIYKVRVTVKDTQGKVIWKKTLKNAYLYVFSGGQVQVGKPKFDQIVIQKKPYSDKFIGMIREKEGIY